MVIKDPTDVLAVYVDMPDRNEFGGDPVGAREEFGERIAELPRDPELVTLYGSHQVARWVLWGMLNEPGDDACRAAVEDFEVVEAYNNRYYLGENADGSLPAMLVREKWERSSFKLFGKWTLHGAYGWQRQEVLASNKPEIKVSDRLWLPPSASPSR